MPYRIFNAEEAAEYLHLTAGDIARLVKDREMPFEQRGERVLFHQQEIDAWASQRILGLSQKRLSEYHVKSTRGTMQIFPDKALMPQMIKPEAINPALKSKTKASVLRDMVALAELSGQINNSRDLLQSLEQREELCPTAIPGGLALLHARHHDAFLFESSFMAIGRSLQNIHFGSPDGKPTNLFFLICCQDDRIHLHTLARICLIAMETDLLEGMRQAADAQAMYECLTASEAEALLKKK